MSSEALSELDFRKKAKELFKLLETRADSCDPDLLEVIPGQGGLTILLCKKQKVILSVQAPVKQLWLAVAHKGEAHHFSWMSGQNQWIDDKGRNLELVSTIQKIAKESTGLDFLNL
jgi:iron donor protein CyaY